MTTVESLAPGLELGSADDIHLAEVKSSSHLQRAFEWLNEWADSIPRKEKIVYAAGMLGTALGGVEIGRRKFGRQ